MEDTLRAGISMSRIKALCLNPCFNGRYSQSFTFGSKSGAISES